MKRLKTGLLWKAMAAGAMLVVGALIAVALLSSPLGGGLTRITQKAINTLTERITTVSTPLPVIVEQLHGLNRLECARQVNRHIIEAQSQSGLLPAFLSKDRLEMIVQTEAVAGVDLSKLGDGDVAVVEGILVVRLPAPEVLSIRIEDGYSHVYHRERGWLVLTPDKDLEREARLKAHSHARQAARTGRLLEAARGHAEENLRALLQPAGFQEVRFEWADRVRAEPARSHSEPRA